MKNTFATALAALAISAAPALAQTQQTGQSQSPTPTSGTSGTTHHAKKSSATASPQAFIKDAAIGGLAEVDLGKLAKDKASSNDVKQFADRLVTDHTKANDQLKKVAQGKNVQLPTELDAKHQATVDRLSKLSGDAFDKAYMKEVLSNHKRDIAAFKKESTTSTDPDVKQFASNTLPTLEEHLKMAQDTASKVGVAPTSEHTKGKKGSGL